MRVHMQLILSIAVAAVTGGAVAQTATTGVGRAASAAVTPGDQNMGRTPDNRSGGMMGNDRTGTDSTTIRNGRTARADRG